MLLAKFGAVDSADPELANHVAYAQWLTGRWLREGQVLLNDPDLGCDELLPNFLRSFRRLSEEVATVEATFLLFLERYGERDRKLTRLCGRLTAQVNWPISAPLVGAFSNDYSTVPAFYLISAPAGEGATLLGIPDLCHELGHNLLSQRYEDLIGDFVQVLSQHVQLQKAETPELAFQYDHWFSHWMDGWLAEFVSDMIAVYLVGPPFGWQHVRLCAGRTALNTYRPSLGESASHPADEARLRGIIAVLDLMGSGPEARQIDLLWHSYIRGCKVTCESTYACTYPNSLIHSLAGRVIAGCETLKIVPYTRPHCSEHSISKMLAEAWTRFRENPQTYPGWETAEMNRLWHELGVCA